MKYETEQTIATHVSAFVATLNGRFREHCSDAMLVGLLMQRLCRESQWNQRASRAEVMLAGDPNAAYDAAQPVFERVLERHCQAGGNGHHVAQNFGTYMETALAKDQLTTT